MTTKEFMGGIGKGIFGRKSIAIRTGLELPQVKVNISDVLGVSMLQYV